MYIVTTWSSFESPDEETPFLFDEKDWLLQYRRTINRNMKLAINKWLGCER